MSVESTLQEVLKAIPRFRILCVGCTGVGKSSLVNRVFGISEAKASQYAVGEASIDQEFVSSENKYFVLHDSKGFEPGDNINFDLAARFLEQRCSEKLLKNQLHAIWLTIETPRAGGRILEEGDKKLLALAHKLSIPVVVVFTKFDMLVRSNEKGLKQEMDGSDEAKLREASQARARDAFANCVQSLAESLTQRNIPIPPYAHISVARDYEDTIAKLVDLTCIVVHDRLKDDAWVTWAIAQRASVPVKVRVCVDKGVNLYYHALSGSIPGAGSMLLGQCLARVRQDIVTCWNFKDVDKILDGTEFEQLMLYIVQDLQTGSLATPAPALDKISQFVNLVTASTGATYVASPVAILGLSYFFLKWISDAVMQRIPDVECLFMAYSIDLVSVLRALFDFTLKPDLVGAVDWRVLEQAFEYYEHSSRRQNHDSCRSLYSSNGRILSRENFRRKIREQLRG